MQLTFSMKSLFICVSALAAARARGIRSAQLGGFRMATGMGSAADNCSKPHCSVDAPPPDDCIEFSEALAKYRAKMIPRGAGQRNFSSRGVVQ